MVSNKAAYIASRDCKAIVNSQQTAEKPFRGLFRIRTEGCQDSWPNIQFSLGLPILLSTSVPPFEWLTWKECLMQIQLWDSDPVTQSGFGCQRLVSIVCYNKLTLTTREHRGGLLAHIPHFRRDLCGRHSHYNCA